MCVDQVIVPWNSSIFEFYAPNSTDTTIAAQDQLVYLKDTFGLRTLDERGAVIKQTPPGVLHSDWLHNTDLIRSYIIPHLN